MNDKLKGIYKEISIGVFSFVSVFVLWWIYFVIVGILGELGFLSFMDFIAEPNNISQNMSLLIIFYSILLFLILGLPNKKYKIFFRDITIICIFLLLSALCFIF